MAGKFLILALGLVPVVAKAEWVKTDVRDEMRGTNTTLYSQEVPPIDGLGPNLTLRVFDKNDGAPGVMLNLSKGAAEGCPVPEPGRQTCDLQARFDEGEVQGISFATKDGKSLMPTGLGAFSGAVLNAKVFYIELPIDGTRMQYRYDLSGLNVKYNPGPEISILGFVIGNAYSAEKPGLKISRGAGNHVCYSGENLSGAFQGSVVSKATLCFYKDVFYQAIVVPGTKASYASGYKYLTSKFGKPDPEGIYPSWPDDGDKLISRSVREASYFALQKNRYDYPFIITDEAWSLMAPEFK